jgi:hypothetical protein
VGVSRPGCMQEIAAGPLLYTLSNIAQVYSPHPVSIMFAHSLTADIGLKVGPTMFQVLVQHYFEHIKLDVEKSDLKQDDVLYHEAFTIVKVSYSLPWPILI